MLFKYTINGHKTPYIIVSETLSISRNSIVQCGYYQIPCSATICCEYHGKPVHHIKYLLGQNNSFPDTHLEIYDNGVWQSHGYGILNVRSSRHSHHFLFHVDRKIDEMRLAIAISDVEDKNMKIFGRNERSLDKLTGDEFAALQNYYVRTFSMFHHYEWLDAEIKIRDINREKNQAKRLGYSYFRDGGELLTARGNITKHNYYRVITKIIQKIIQ